MRGESRWGEFDSLADLVEDEGKNLVLGLQLTFWGICEEEREKDERKRIRGKSPKDGSCV